VYGGSVDCPSGDLVTGGGVQVTAPTVDADVDTYPSSTSSWAADVRINTTGDTFTVYAICQLG